MRYILLILLVIGYLASNSNAEEVQPGTLSQPAPIKEIGYKAHTGWAPFIGAGVGYTNYNPNLNVEGVPSSLKLLGSYTLEQRNGTFDIGYGMGNQQFSKSTARETALSTGELELAGRYQFENQIQLGVVYNQLFSKGLNYGANQSDAEFAGIQLLKEIGIGRDYIGRFGGRILTSLNVNNESVNMAMLDFQIGWGAK